MSVQDLVSAAAVEGSSASPNDRRFTIISSDGHAAAEMADYGPYIEPSWRPAFDDFLEQFESLGRGRYDPVAMRVARR